MDWPSCEHSEVGADTISLLLNAMTLPSARAVLNTDGLQAVF